MVVGVAQHGRLDGEHLEVRVVACHELVAHALRAGPDDEVENVRLLATCDGRTDLATMRRASGGAGDFDQRSGQ